MSSNDPVVKVWNWDNFRGWLSDNAYIGQQGSFQNGSVNIDVESEPGWVKLTSLAKDYLTTTGVPVFILDGSKFWVTGIYTFNDDKSIYLDTTLKAAFNSTPATTMGIIYHATIMKVWGTPFLFLFSSTGLHKAATDLSSFTYNEETIEASTSKTSIVYAGDIYFTSGNKLYQYTTSEVMTTLYTADSSDTFTGMTFFQDQFKLYSSVNSTNGRQYIIPLWATAPDYVTEWTWLPILWASNMGGTDYVITGWTATYTDLYVVSWTQRQQIHWNIEGITGRTFGNANYTYISPIMSRRDDMFIVWYTANNSDWALFKYGRFFGGMQDILSCPVGISSTEITAIAFSWPYIYMGTKTGSTYKVKRLETNTPPTATNYYAVNGSIISLIFDWGNPCNTKILKRIRIAYDCDNAATIKKGWSFALYARMKNSQTFTQIGATQTKTDVWMVDITENTIIESGFNNFTQIEYKIVLTAGDLSWNLAYTPLIKSVQTFYYDNIDV